MFSEPPELESKSQRKGIIDNGDDCFINEHEQLDCIWTVKLPETLNRYTQIRVLLRSDFKTESTLDPLHIGNNKYDGILSSDVVTSHASPLT